MVFTARRGVARPRSALCPACASREIAVAATSAALQAAVLADRLAAIRGALDARDDRTAVDGIAAELRRLAEDLYARGSSGRDPSDRRSTRRGSPANGTERQ
jgi:hypothetical protein